MSDKPARQVRMIGLTVGDEDVLGVSEVLRSGMIAQGPEVQKLERAFAERVRVKHAIAVSSGTAAVHAMLAALELGPGDEVITTALSFAATVNMIVATGATPRFADVDERTFNLDPASVGALVGPRTKAILAVDLYGRIADYDGLSAVASGRPVLADACQAAGARRGDGREAGAIAHASAFSLYATKNWQCGEGGIITTDDDRVAAFCRRFRHHGQEPSGVYDYRHLGFNYRMTDFTARFARSQLRLLDDGNARRRQIAARYGAALAGITQVQRPEIPEHGHALHQYTLRAERRDALRHALQAAGVATQIYYPRPLTSLPHLGAHPDRERVPRTERLCTELVSLPIHARLTDDDVDYVIDQIRAFYR